MNTAKFRILFAVVLLSAFALVAGGRARAHDATPGPDQPITDTVLASGMPNDAPGKVLQIEEVTIAEGAAIPVHVHPGAYAIYVESGAFGFTVIKGEALIVRAGSTTAEPIAAGAEVIANPGDSIFENGGVVHSARNAGTGTVRVYTAALLTAGVPSLQPSNDEGTPVSS